MESVFFVALTPGMAQVAEQVRRESSLSFSIEVVSFDKGPEVARANPQVDVLISRGLMVDLLRKHTDKPVVGLTMTIAEMLESVQRLVAGGATQVGVVAHSGFLEMGGADFVVGDVTIHVRPWNTLEDIPGILERLSRSGVNAIAGDKGGSTAAKERGCVVDLLESGLPAIKRAVNEALKIAQAYERERECERERRKCFEQGLAELYSDLEQAASSLQELASSSQALAASSHESSNIAQAATQEE